MLRFLFPAIIANTLLLAAPSPRDLAHSLPVVFEPNVGRWDRQVKFAAQTGAYRVLLTAGGAELSASHPVDGQPHAISISMLNANPRAEVSGSDQVRCQTSYFVGNKKENWRTGIANYARVKYQSIYPGIDLVYYGKDSELEYDFLVGPGADPSRIRLQFGGVERLSVTPGGDLLVEAGGTRLIERKPAVYQQQAGSARREIAGRFTLRGDNVVGFELAAYDRSQALTIDPVLAYSSLLGGSAADSVIGVKFDRAGMIYVAGYMTNGDFGVGSSSFQDAARGNPNIFIAKINPAAAGVNSLVYFTYIGGSGADVPYGMQMDAGGNLYLTGSTTSTDFPMAGTPARANNSGGTDVFMLKFNPALEGQAALVFSSYYGGTDLDIGYAIDVDQAGFIYVTGMTQSQDLPLTSTAYQNIRYGLSDAFIVKVDPAAGAFVYSSYMGGESTEQGRAIAVTPSGSAVYFAGDTVSTLFPLAGTPYQPAPLGGGDIFVAQMDLSKSGVDSLVYATYLGGSGLEGVRKMILDPSGKLLLTGYTISPDFPVTAGAVQSNLKGIANVFVTRLDLAAPNIISYSTYFGGSGGDVAYDMALDATGNVYLTGYTNSMDFPVTADAIQSKNGGGFDVFVSKLNLGGGSVVYSTYAGQSSINVGYGIAVSAAGAIAVGGQSGEQNDGPSVGVTDGAAQNFFAGGQSDGFVLLLKN